MNTADHTADAARLAAIHAACFTVPRPWSAVEIAQFLNSPTCFCAQTGSGFGLVRTIGDEAEILTLAVLETARRKGMGRAILKRLESHAAKAGASRVILEVSRNNTAARALYRACGYTRSGCRPGYYRSTGTKPEDALILSRSLA